MSTLVGNLVPRALNFFHLCQHDKKYALWVRYCLCGAVCLRSCRKINSHKMEGLCPLQVMLHR